MLSMRMKKIKRVALVHVSGWVGYFSEEYPSSARDIDILNMLYEVGKNVWLGNELYKIIGDPCDHRCYYRYEVYTVREER